MKFNYSLFYLLTFCSILLYAKPINSNRALEIASTFKQSRMQQKSYKMGIKAAMPAMKQMRESNNTKGSAQKPYYIYNIGNKEGFVIVSGNDATKPVLGYSDTGEILSENMPEGLKELLESYQKEINALSESTTSTTTSTTAAFNSTQNIALAAQATAVVEPLLGSIKWSQDNPYNLLSPFDTNSQTHIVSGCVATAMAQIMKYHRWPITGTGIHSYTENDFGVLSANFGATTYQWDDMLDQYSSTATASEELAVATLMYHCAVSVDMDFSPSGSGSSIYDAGKALKTYFGYDSEIQMYTRDFYNTNEWAGLIQKELNEARPILYAANSVKNEGHAFVCDGYDSNGFYHINWGWGGYDNGYFELSSLSWSNEGIIGATEGFSAGHLMLTGIKKADNINITSYQLGMYSNFAPNTYQLNNLRTNVVFNISLANYGVNNFTGQIAVGYVKSGETVMNRFNATSQPLTLSPLNGLTGTITTNLSNLATEGTYYLYPLYKAIDSSSWSIIPGNYANKNKLIVTRTGSSATISYSTDKPNLVLNSITTSVSPMIYNKSLNIDVTIQNTGTEYNSLARLYLYSEIDTSLHQVLALDNITCLAGAIQTYHFKGTPTLPQGSYMLKVYYDNSNNYCFTNWQPMSTTNQNPTPVSIQLLSTDVSSLLSIKPSLLKRGNLIETQSAETPVSLEVIDLYGRTILLNQHSKTMDISNLTKGMFLLKVRTSAESYTLPFIK